jgi:hypothetical protein
VQISVYDAEDVFKILKSHDKQLALDHTVGIRRQNAYEDAEEPDLEPEERTVTVWKLVE